MFFDVNDGDFIHRISDNMGMDSDGNMMMRVGWIWTRAKCIWYPVGMTMMTMITLVFARRGMMTTIGKNP